MPYIGGASPNSQVGTSAAYRSQSYTSTASQTTFTVDGGYTPGFIDVYVNGIKQVNGVDVTATNGTTVVFASALSAGYTVEIQALRNIAVNATSLPVASIAFSDGTVLNSAWGSVGYVQHTGTGTQTAFSTSPYTASSVNYTSVYISGVYQRKNTYSWAGSTLTFTSAPPNGAAIEIVINYQTSQVGLPSAGTISPSMLTTGGPSWTSGGNVSISSALTAGSASLSGTFAAGNTTITGTANVSGNVSVGGTLTTSSQGISKGSLPTGSILQVVTNYPSTGAVYTTTASSYAEINTAYRTSITPISSSSILILEWVGLVGGNNSSAISTMKFYDVTNSADVGLSGISLGSRGIGHASFRQVNADSNDRDNIIMRAVVPSSSTTARTYSIYHYSEGGATRYFNATATDNNGCSYVKWHFIITEIVA